MSTPVSISAAQSSALLFLLLFGRWEFRIRCPWVIGGIADSVDVDIEDEDEDEDGDGDEDEGVDKDEDKGVDEDEDVDKEDPPPLLPPKKDKMFRCPFV